MPKSRVRTNKGKAAQKSKADRRRISDGFYRKLDEYMTSSLEELKELSELGIVKGTYKNSLEEAIKHKEEIALAAQTENNEPGNKSIEQGTRQESNPILEG